MRDYSPGTFNVSLQDRDLLQRMNLYFDAFESHLQSGEGWLVFNAGSRRATRIVQYLQQRLIDAKPVTSFFVPWRDFSLTSYMVEVELQTPQAQLNSLAPARKRELEIANKISQQTMVRMVTDDMLVVSGVAARHSHEVRYLAATIQARYRSRLSTILLTPDTPHAFETSITIHSEHGTATWNELSQRLLDTSLIAL